MRVVLIASFMVAGMFMRASLGQKGCGQYCAVLGVRANEAVTDQLEACIMGELHKCEANISLVKPGTLGSHAFNPAQKDDDSA